MRRKISFLIDRLRKKNNSTSKSKQNKQKKITTHRNLRVKTDSLLQKLNF